MVHMRAALLAAAAVAASAQTSAAELMAMTRPGDDMYCVTFSPYTTGYMPYENEPPEAVIAAQLDEVVKTQHVSCIMVYGTLNAPGQVAKLAAARGLKVLQVIYLDPEPFPVADSIEAGKKLALDYPDTIKGLVCGNEVRRRNTKAVAEMLVTDCLTQLRAAGVPQPIGHAATFSEWCNEDVAGALYPSKCTKWAAVAEAVDFMSVTAIAWWQNTVVPAQFPCISAENAAAWHVARLQEVKGWYPGKEVLLGTFGWVGAKTPYTYNLNANTQCAVASDEKRTLAAVQTLNRLSAAGLSGILFETAQEQWKVPKEEAGFGFCAPLAPFTCALPSLAWTAGQGASASATPDETETPLPSPELIASGAESAAVAGTLAVVAAALPLLLA